MILKALYIILDILSKRLYQFVEQTKYIIETDCMSEPTSFPIIYNNDTKESWASKMIFSYCKIEGKSRFMSIHWLYWLGRLSWRFSSAYLFSNMFCTHLITIPIQKCKNRWYIRRYLPSKSIANKHFFQSNNQRDIIVCWDFTFYWILRCPWGKACCEKENIVLHTLFHFLA